MASTTLADRLMDAADTLLAEGGRSSAFRRRAVSTAYYAVFHALAKLCADYVTRSYRRSSDEYARVYRSLEHRQLKAAFGQSPLKEDVRLRKIGAITVRLQAERHRADYSPPVTGLFSKSDTEELLEQARQAVSDLERLRPDDEECRILVTSLLFKGHS